MLVNHSPMSFVDVEFVDSIEEASRVAMTCVRFPMTSRGVCEGFKDNDTALSLNLSAVCDAS